MSRFAVDPTNGPSPSLASVRLVIEGNKPFGFETRQRTSLSLPRLPQLDQTQESILANQSQQKRLPSS